MDPKLAAIYGTGNYAPQPEQSDLEKMAAAELLVKLAEEEGVDLDQFNDQEIAGMITSLYKAAEETPAEEKKEEKAEEKKEEKTSQFGAEHEKKETKEEEKKEEEKVAEADFLGRVMAHAMVHELREIEKQAQTGEESQAARFLARSGDTLAKGLKASGEEVGPHIGAARLGARRVGAAVSGAGKKMVELAQKHPTAAKALGGAALVGTGFAIGRKLGKGKKQPEAEQTKKGSADESAFETLAREAAFAMAKEAGYIDEEGNLLVQEQEKQASQLDQALYVRALQICEEAGIPVEWNQE